MTPKMAELNYGGGVSVIELEPLSHTAPFIELVHFCNFQYWLTLIIANQTISTTFLTFSGYYCWIKSSTISLRIYLSGSLSYFVCKTFAWILSQKCCQAFPTKIFLHPHKGQKGPVHIWNIIDTLLRTQKELLRSANLQTCIGTCQIEC